MLRIIAEGFLFGLAQAPLCAGACAPVFLAHAWAREREKPHAHVRGWAEFLLGRLIGYVLVGLLAGWLGSHLTGGPPLWLMAGVNAVLGAALLLFAAAQTAPRMAACSLFHKWGNRGRFPVVLGLLMGLNICPPFVAGVKQVVEMGGAAAGAAFFGSFFVATTLVMLPMLGVAFANWLPAVRSVGRAICATVGLILLCSAASALRPEPAHAAPTPDSPTVAASSAEPESAATFVEEKSEPAPHGVLLERGKPVALLLRSTELAPDAEGFNGPVPVEVEVGLDGVIRAVRLLPGHQETAAYYDKVRQSRLMDSLEGRGPGDRLVVGEDVDAVTGATYSSMGVVDGVRGAVRKAAEVLLPLYQEKPAEPAPATESPKPVVAEASPWRFDLWALAVAALAGMALLAEWKRVGRARTPLLILSALILGVWGQMFFSVKHVLDIVLLRFPPVRTHGAWYVLVAAALGTALWRGRVYCAYVCPFGAATELLGRLNRRPLKISIKWDRRLRRIKYGVLVALAVGFAATGNPGLLDLEPFGDAFSWGFLNMEGDWLFRAGWLGFLVVASLLVSRFFCRFLCPAGAAMAFLAKHRLSGRVRPDRCIECGECIVSCPKRGGKAHDFSDLK